MFRASPEEIEGDRREMQMFIDINPWYAINIPKDSLQNLIAYGAEEFMLFGADCVASRLSYGRQHIERGVTILRQIIRVSSETVGKIMDENAFRFLGIKK